MKAFAWIAAAAALAVPVLAQTPVVKEVEQLKGRQIPAFRMTDMAGKVHTDRSLRGRVVLLDFWATWCGPCKAASPTMQRLHQQFARQGLVVIGANTFEDGNARAKVAAYAKENKYTYTFTLGNDRLAESWGISGIPAFIFVDRQGRVAHVATGFNRQSSPAEFERIARSLLARR